VDNFVLGLIIKVVAS